MLLERFEKIGEYRAVIALRKFFDSVWFIAIVAALMACSNLFGWELPVFYIYLLFGLLIVLFDDDLKGVIPVVLCCYPTISAKNNPALEIENSAFYQPWFVGQLTAIIVAAVLMLAVRLVSILLRKRAEGRTQEKKKKLPVLTFGFLVLGLGFSLGGIFSPYYSVKTVLFGMTELASLCALYFLFYYTVDWQKIDKAYWAYLFTAIGLGITLQVLGIYFKEDVFSGGVFNRATIVVGWGNYNNVGCIMAMSLPAPLYLAATKKRGWVYVLISVVLGLGMIFTQSRGSILFGGMIYLAGVVMVLVRSKGIERRKNTIAFGSLAAVVVVAIIALFTVPYLTEKLVNIFKIVFEQGVSDNGRIEIYENGIKDFLVEPFFGVGFYQCTAPRGGGLSPDAFLPPRYHNTFIQLLATGGIFALGCYIFHRVQTALLFFKRPSFDKGFLVLSIAALLLTSTVECHFFSLGPGLFYAILLIFAEGLDRKPDIAQS